MSQKALGPEGAKLLGKLTKQGKNIFSVSDAQKITGKDSIYTAVLLSRLKKSEWLTRIKRGKYAISSLTAEGIENWYVVARELIAPEPYYISYYSALAIWGMVTHPVLAIYISTPLRRKNRSVGEAEFRFVYTKPENIWGIEKFWVTKQEQVKVSNFERTIIDSLNRSELCGGITEIAKGIWLRKDDIDYQKLTGYARDFGVKAVIKRLGFLLETLKLGREEVLLELQEESKISKSYVSLDPLLPKRGRHLAKWRLLVNVSPEEISRMRRV